MLSDRDSLLRGLVLAAVLAAAGALTALGAACDGDDGGGGGGGGNAVEVEGAVKSAIEAWNGRDIDGFLVAVTDAYLSDEFDFASRDEARDGLAEEIGDPAFTLGDFSNTEISGATATTQADLYFGEVGSPQVFSMLQEGESWVIDGAEFTAGDAGDASAVDLSLTEHAFTFDEAQITDGNIAFNVTNDGAEEHEVIVARVPADLDLEEAVTLDEPPEGFDPIGGLFAITPGTETTLLFAEDLSPGRYALVCFVNAADDRPHAVLGMLADFTVPAP